MIFAHTPAGFIIGHLLLKKWIKQNKITDFFTKQKIIVLYIVGMIGAVIPDFDLFYYYFISASVSHRELFTHSFSIYLSLFFIIYIIAYLIRNTFLTKANIIFFIGVLSHLITDSIGYGIMWLYPLNKKLYGLASFDYVKHSFVTQYFFTVNYSMELIFIAVACILLINLIIKSKKIVFILKIVIAIISCILITTLFIINQHLFIGTSDGYYDDTDNDGIVNKRDADIDNDGIANLNDPDINNNNLSNQKELNSLIKNSEGVWYDFSDAGLIEIPLRMGFVTNEDLIRRYFDNIGIYFRYEMKKDYENNYQDYETGPNSKSFDRNVKNWIAWFKHSDKLVSIDNIKEYDILIFKNNYTALLIEDNKIIEANPDKNKVVISDLSEIIKSRGEIIFAARLLP